MLSKGSPQTATRHVAHAVWRRPACGSGKGISRPPKRYMGSAFCRDTEGGFLDTQAHPSLFTERYRKRRLRPVRVASPVARWMRAVSRTNGEVLPPLQSSPISFRWNASAFHCYCAKFICNTGNCCCTNHFCTREQKPEKERRKSTVYNTNCRFFLKRSKKDLDILDPVCYYLVEHTP